MAAAQDDLVQRAKAGDGEARMELARQAAKLGRRAEADHWIAEAAAAGQQSACLTTGVWRLAGYRGPRDIEAGVDIVRRAAEAGEPAAMSLYAALHVSDALGLRDWAAAQHWLLRAAEAHDPRAQLQVALMLPPERKWQSTKLALAERAAGKGYPTALYFAGRMLLEDGGQDGQALARLMLAARANEVNALRLLRGRRAPTAEPDSPVFRLDPVNWGKLAEAVVWPHTRALPQAVVRHAAPRVATFNRLLTTDECDYVISRGVPFLKGPGQKRTQPVNRTNATARFGLTETDVLIQSLDALAARAIGRAPDAGETLALMHYGPGQSYVPDSRAVVEDTHAAAPLGGLAKTMIVYLNDGYEGGESVFPRIGWRYKGRRGDALLWELRGPDGRIDPKAVPEGSPPRAGDKFVLSKLMRRG